MRTVINSADYARAKRMTFNQLNDYILSIYLSGKTDMRDELLGGTDEAVVLDTDKLKDILLEVDGLTETMADEVLNKIDILMKGECENDC